MGCMTSNGWLDFGDDADDDVDIAIFKRIFIIAGQGNSMNFADTQKSCQ